MNANDIREPNRRAVETCIEIVGRVRPEDLSLPTPCAGWNLNDLLTHMTAQHRGFQAASQGLGGDLGQWAPDPGTADPEAPDPVGSYLAAARDVLRAFAADGVLDRTFVLPEISPALEFPAVQAIGFHFIDYLVHGWDVARTLGEKYVLDDDLAPAAIRIAGQVPDGEERLRPGAAFRPSLPIVPPGSGGATVPALDRILATLGRSPAWPD
jgi:uncharacterized protein (TIGR03086 family)